MGMFDKDKEYGTIITSLFEVGEPFILHGARISKEEVPTQMGSATQSELKVSKADKPAETFVCTTLASSIATKVREAEKDDFPAVVALARVPTKYGRDALVLQFLKPYDARDEGRQSFDAAASAIPADGATVPPVSDDPIPF